MQNAKNEKASTREDGPSSFEIFWKMHFFKRERLRPVIKRWLNSIVKDFWLKKNQNNNGPSCNEAKSRKTRAPCAEQNLASRLPRANLKKNSRTWQTIRQIYIFSTSQKTKAPHLNNLLIILTDLKIKVQYRIKIYVLAYTCRYWLKKK